jgi:enamine deaminase RidA (YjgF/YER057c/UK114 family)
VINGASDFLGEALGDTGKHARAAVSAPSLPFGVAVEIDGVFQIK